MQFDADSASYDLNELPRYRVTFTGDVSKDGDRLNYRILVVPLADEDPSPATIERQWEDFEHLHARLTAEPLNGVIVPPLPAEPAADSKAAEARTKKRLGSSSAYVQGDDFRGDCASLSAYLDAMLVHPLFGRSKLLADFLERAHLPPSTRRKKGLFSKMGKSFEAFKIPTASGVTSAFR